MEYRTVAFHAANQPEALDAETRLKERYDHVAPDEADIIVALGGDGFMLQTLHQFMDRQTPIFGMNRGSVGFLMNQYHEENLPDRLARAESIFLHPLRMTAIDVEGSGHTALAINEVSLLRSTRFAAKIKVDLDNVTRIEEMICDGVLVATPAGSTAYNIAVHGPILPLGAELLALTPISAFRPRRWRGALLPQNAEVTFEVLDAGHRPVSASADFTEIRKVTRVTVRADHSVTPTILFDPEHNLEERIVKEQFLP
jgi:NAD+ kinase